MAGRRILKIGIILFLMAVIFGFGRNTAYAMGYFAESDKTEFILTTDSTELQVGVSNTFTLSISNAEDAVIKEISGLGANDLTVLAINQGGISLRSDTGWTNSVWFYDVMPNKEGNYTIQVVIEYKGETYYSNSVEVSVTKITELSDIKEGKNYKFLPEAGFTENEVYLGQKTVLNYYLYTNYRLFSNGSLFMASIDGLSIAEKQDFKLIKEELELGDGISCTKYIASQRYVSPYLPGEYVIPSEFVILRASERDTFNAIKNYSIQFDTVTLSVKPLPEEGKPVDFYGIVGKPAVDASYNKQLINYNETVTLDVVLHGNCNLDAVENVIRGGLPGFVINESMINKVEDYKDGEYYAEREFRVVLVPEKTGDIEIAPIRIPYFDTVQQCYSEVQIPGTTITVEGDMPQWSTQGEQASGGKVIKISQINYGKFLSGGVITIRLSVKLLYTALIIIAFLSMIAVGLIIILRRKKRSKELEALYKQLYKAEDINEIYNCFNGMMKYCFGINLKASSRDSLEERLCNQGLVKPELSAKILNAMEDMERKTVGVPEIKNKVKLIYKALRNRCYPAGSYKQNKV